MALEQYFQEAVARNDSNGEYGASIEKWKSVSPTVDGCENNHSGGFDCNICLDFVQDPVVTLCGHLYCWPCIYKWIHFQSIPSENPKQQLPHPQCPVCKTEISQRNIVPLYGRGQSTKPSEGKAPHLGIVVPSRPPSPRACGGHTPITTATTGSQLLHRSYPQQFQRYHSNLGSYAATPMLSLGSTMRADMVHPTVAMFVEMIYTRIFGNSETTMFAYPNSYQLAGSNSPRVRRHIIQTDQSLSRVCFFLCCCLVLCLLLF